MSLMARAAHSSAPPCVLQRPPTELVCSLDQKAPSEGPSLVDTQPTLLGCPSLSSWQASIHTSGFPVHPIQMSPLGFFLLCTPTALYFTSAMWVCIIKYIKTAVLENRSCLSHPCVCMANPVPGN